MAEIELDPARAVLVIQDMQNDVIIAGGAFADSGSPGHATEQNVVANVAALAAPRARRACRCSTSGTSSRRAPGASS